MNYLIIDGYIQNEWKSLVVLETNHDVFHILTNTRTSESIKCIVTHGLRLNDFQKIYLTRVSAGIALQSASIEDYKILCAFLTMDNLFSLQTFSQVRLTQVKIDI